WQATDNSRLTLSHAREHHLHRFPQTVVCQRRLGPMRNFWQDMRYAARTLRNAPGFTIIAIVALGLGMAVNTTIFSVINGMLLRPKPVPHAEQLTVLAMEQPGTSGFQKFSYPVYQDISRQTGV